MAHLLAKLLDQWLEEQWVLGQGEHGSNEQIKGQSMVIIPPRTVGSTVGSIVGDSVGAVGEVNPVHTAEGKDTLGDDHWKLTSGR